MEVKVQGKKPSRLRLKCDGTRAETRFHLSTNRTSPFNSTGVSVQSTTGSRAVHISLQGLYRSCKPVFCGHVTLYWLPTPFSFPLHFPSRASLCAITFQTQSTYWRGGWMGPRAVLDIFEKTQVSCPCLDSNSGLSTPYPSHYNDSANLVHKTAVYEVLNYTHSLLTFISFSLQRTVSRPTIWFGACYSVYKQNLKDYFLRSAVQLHDIHYCPYNITSPWIKKVFLTHKQKTAFVQYFSEYYTGRQLGHKLVWFTNLNSKQ
jgi:hypothetical protein